ncbi:MAG: hypothetical protein KDD47_12595, partial [Acidobacteria bacterium]|nr:hypothetical protein [Acidobacteriota bacterium]
PPGWAYLAAAVVLVGVGLAFLWPQLRPRTLAGELAEAQLPDGWAVHEWNAVFRSGNSPEERVQAFRLGVHHQDLEVALLQGRVDAAKAALEGLFDEGSSVFFPEFLYRRVAKALDAQGPKGALRELAAPRRQLLAELEDRALGSFFEWGRWTESVRLAAATKQGHVLRSRAFETAAQEILDSDLDQRVKEEVSWILGASKAGEGDGVPEGLEERADTILGQNGQLRGRIP